MIIPKIPAIAIFLLLGLSMKAEIYETVEMTDGTIYEGYVSEQFRSGKIVISSEKTVGIIPAEDIDKITPRDVAVTSLSKPWRDYLGEGKKRVILSDIHITKRSENEAVDSAVAMLGITPFDSITVTLADSVSGKIPDIKNPKKKVAKPIQKKAPSSKKTVVEVIRNVLILEEGAYVKYITFDPMTVDATAGDIKRITRPLPDKASLSGLRDIILTKDGRRYAGNIIETIPGKYIKIQSEKGVRNVSYSDIVSVGVECLDAELPIFTQAPFINRIKCSDGSSVEGVMTEQNYSNGNITVMTPANVAVVKKNRDVTLLMKIPNKDYKIHTDIIIESDTLMYANRTELMLTPVTKQNDKAIEIRMGNAKFNRIDLNPDGSLEIELKQTVTNERWTLLPVDVKPKDKLIKIPFASIFDLNILPSEKDVSVNGTLLLVYEHMRAGSYILINSHRMSAALLTLKK